MPNLPPFKLERYFGQYEFKVRYLLSASDCEALTLPELLALADDDSRARWEALSLGYTESAGHPVLREEVARLYETLSADDVLILTPEEGIFIAMQTLLEPGDHVIAIAPAYQSLSEIARAVGCSVTTWPVILKAEGWGLDLEQLAQSFTPQTRLLVINFPHNPTGYLPTHAEFEAILNLARQHNVYVFADEMYRWLELNSEHRLPAVCDVYEKGIVLSGLSKSFALPGLRLGWLATHQRDVMVRLLTYKDYTTICHSAPSEILALMAVRAKDSIVARNVEIVQTNVRHAAQFCAKHSTLFRWLTPLAGSIAFPQWLGPGTIEALCEASVNTCGVMVVPGSMFDAPGNYFRFGLGRRNFSTALEHWHKFLTENLTLDA